MKLLNPFFIGFATATLMIMGVNVISIKYAVGEIRRNVIAIKVDVREIRRATDD